MGAREFGNPRFAGINRGRAKARAATAIAARNGCVGGAGVRDRYATASRHRATDGAGFGSRARREAVKTITRGAACGDAGSVARRLGRVAHIGNAGIHQAVRRRWAFRPGQARDAHRVGGVANHTEGRAVCILGAGWPADIADAMGVAGGAVAIDDAIDATVVRGVAKAARTIAIALARQCGHALVGSAKLSSGTIRVRRALDANAPLRIANGIAGTVALTGARREHHAMVAQAVTTRWTVLGLHARNTELGRGLAKLPAGSAIGIAGAR